MDIYSQYFNNYNDEDVIVPFPEENNSNRSHFNYPLDKIKETLSYFIGKDQKIFIREAYDRFSIVLKTIVDRNKYCKGYTSNFDCLNIYPDDYILEYFEISQDGAKMMIILKGRPVNQLNYGMVYTETLTFSIG